MYIKVNDRPTILSYFSFAICCTPLFFFSCTISKQISKQADKILLNDTAIRSGHMGISIYEPATGKYWYNHDAEKYFVPASNTKLFTLYAGLKYLGDTLAGLEYNVHDSTAEIYPTGDPTFLHPDFISQPVLDFLKKQRTIIINPTQPINIYGPGWAWDDYQDSYMVPRAAFPMYGNLAMIKWINKDSICIYPRYFNGIIGETKKLTNGFTLKKKFGDNILSFYNGNDRYKTIPFEPDMVTGIKLLMDTLKNENIYSSKSPLPNTSHGRKIIYSRPSDSLFIPMMHDSDNFFAEQTLLMVSKKKLGIMDDEKIISELLASDLKEIPQKPRWVDGSGLSRYNMFTPKSFVYLLNKLKTDFGFERMKHILPTGGTGTLKNYYKSNRNHIYAKTGTLSNHVALSGYIITHKKKLLIFSILANHFQTGATPIRIAIEQFIVGIIKKY